MTREETFKFLKLLTAPYRIELDDFYVESWALALERVDYGIAMGLVGPLLAQPGRVFCPTPGEVYAEFQAVMRQRRPLALPDPIERNTSEAERRSVVDQLRAKHPDLFQ